MLREHEDSKRRNKKRKKKDSTLSYYDNNSNISLEEICEKIYIFACIFVYSRAYLDDLISVDFTRFE